MHKNIVDIVVIADDGFMEASIVMLTSAKVNKNNTSYYRVHFICNNVCRLYKKKLLELQDQDFEILIYDETSKAYFNEVNIKIHVTATTFLKLEIPEILRGVSKVIHIDGDVIVQGDLWQMYNIDLADNTLAVTRSIRMEKSGRIQLRGIDKSFNAGIMLMNLDSMRKNKDSEKLINMLRTLPDEWWLLEQDCLNVYYRNKCLYLPIRYNCFYFTMIKDFTIDEVNEFYGTNYESYDEMVSDALLIHLAGTPGRRPWQVRDGVHGQSWQYYYNISPLKHLYHERPDSSCVSLQKELNIVKQELALAKKELNAAKQVQNRLQQEIEMSIYTQKENYHKVLYRYRLLQLKSFITWGKRRERYISRKRDLKVILRKVRAARKSIKNKLFTLR